MLFISFAFTDSSKIILDRKQSKNAFRQDSSLDMSITRNESELIEFIEATMTTHLIPGLSVSVVKEDNIVWQKHFGYANIEQNISVNENTLFILSSISKTVTGTALMQLFEQNLFELDDDINQYLPFNVSHPDYPLIPITFKMLLSHTSGINDNWSVMPYYDGDSAVELNSYLSDYLEPDGELYNANTNFTSYMPGANFNYSNIGAALVGLLVEEISELPFNVYCNENIFEPLQMNNSFWFLSEIENLDSVALPYQLNGGTGSTCFEIGCGIYNDSNPCFCDFACIDYGDCCPDYDDVCGEDGSGSNLENLQAYQNYGYSDYPSGQLRSTSNDLAKLMYAYMNGGVFNGVRILESSTIELIKTIHFPSVNSNQGLAWYYKNENDRTLFGHNGGDLGSLTEMFISFSDSVGVILLSNSTNYNAVIQIEDAILDFADQNEFMTLGDINSDNAINIQDIILGVNFILNNDYSSVADLNSDQLVDVIDIVLLVNLIIN